MLRKASLCIPVATTAAAAVAAPLPAVTPSTSRTSDDTSTATAATNSSTTAAAAVAVPVPPKAQPRNYCYQHIFLHQCMQYIARTNSSGSSSSTSISEIEEAMILRALQLARYVLCHAFSMRDVGNVISTLSGNMEYMFTWLHCVMHIMAAPPFTCLFETRWHCYIRTTQYTTRAQNDIVVEVLVCMRCQ
jgi:hypothetical protein